MTLRVYLPREQAARLFPSWFLAQKTCADTVMLQVSI